MWSVGIVFRETVEQRQNRAIEAPYKELGRGSGIISKAGTKQKKPNRSEIRLGLETSSKN